MGTKAQVPAFGAGRLVLIATGTASTAFLPFWLNWLRDSYPDLELRVMLTTSAERFVTAQAVALLSGTGLLRDTWPPVPGPGAPHIELTEWADAFAVYPASANFIARLALGQCDTPAQLALQCTRRVIGVAPSVPPGMTASPAHQEHLRILSGWHNVTVAETARGRSATTGRYDQGVAVPAWRLIELMEKRRLELAEEAGTC